MMNKEREKKLRRKIKRDEKHAQLHQLRMNQGVSSMKTSLKKIDKRDPMQLDAGFNTSLRSWERGPYDEVFIKN